MDTPRLKIGQTFTLNRGRVERFYWIDDILTTKNSKGKVVDIRYVCHYEFCDQIVSDRNFCDSTIVMALSNQNNGASFYEMKQDGIII